MLMGASRVASTWLVDTSDAMFGQGFVVEEYDERVVDGLPGAEQREEIFEEEDVVSYGGNYGPAYSAAPFCDSLNRAVQDGARVVGRSAERFASEYDSYGYGNRRPVVHRQRRVVVERASAAAPGVQPSPAATTVKNASVTEIIEPKK
jgi:hypothetical protein